MHDIWFPIAQRIVTGLNVQPDEVIEVRDLAGRYDVLQAVLLAVELAGATPRANIAPPVYMTDFLNRAAPALLRRYDHHRSRWLHQTDRIIQLIGGRLGEVPPAALQAFGEADNRLTELEEQRRLPFMLVCVPTQRIAADLNLSLTALEAVLIPALSVPIDHFRRDIDAVTARLSASPALTLQTGAGHELHLTRAERPLLSDDGLIDDHDRALGAIVSNLPAGSVYTTVLEDQAHGALWLPAAGPATDVTLVFENGRITDIHAATGAAELAAFFDRHTGEPRRISHIGIGLNPHINQPYGWNIVDEHQYGQVFIAFGENRYMGGQNPSSLNQDFALSRASLFAGDHQLIRKGNLTP